ncbi:MAG: hypothetical protein RL088_3760 [Verrucomicrobiota bacterium]|jgi:hypothetical protein
MRIFVSGMIAGDSHQGGATWAVLQYVLGLRSLGHDVVFVEPVKALTNTSVRYFRDVVRDFGMENRAALLLAGSTETEGLSHAELRSLAAGADVIFNISGMLADVALLEPIPRRVYLDLDPAFIQLWHSEYGIDMRFDAHTHFVTIGLSLGSPACAVPTCRRDWLTTLQPIVLAEWPVQTTILTDALTTVGNWRGYGSVEFRGEHYGQKAHSMRQFFSLPKRTKQALAPALSIHPDEKSDLAALAVNGWSVLDPSHVAATPAAYREFVGGSRGEFGIAKSGYVLSRCGWFSDRSVCYLASGRPVLAQDTGFGLHLPTGEGLLAFDTIESAAAGIEEMNRDYSGHCRAARALAESHFDSRKVLPHLLERVAA